MHLVAGLARNGGLIGKIAAGERQGPVVFCG